MLYLSASSLQYELVITETPTVGVYNTTVQLTRADSAVTVKGAYHKLSFVIRPIKLAEFPTQSSSAVSLSRFVTLEK